MDALPAPFMVPYLMEALEEMLSACTISETLSTIREEYVTIWTTFLCGGVNSEGWTVVAGTARVLGVAGARFPGADELEAFRTMATEWEASVASDSLLLFGLSVVSADSWWVWDMEGWLARRAAIVLLLRRAFRAGSMRTAFSMHISCVYELKLVRCEQGI